MDILSQDHEEFIRQVVDQGEFTSRQQVLEKRTETSRSGEAIELTEEYLQQKSQQMREIIMRRFHERQQG